MRFFVVALLTLLSTWKTLAQHPVFQGQIMKNIKAPGLDEQFEQYTVWGLDLGSLDAYVKNAGPAMSFRLKFGKKDWNIELQENNLLAPGYTLTLHTVDGQVNLAGQENITFRGALAGKGNSLVSLTITHEFLYGFVKDGDEYFFIEPLWYYKPGEPANRLVIYAGAHVKPRPGATCGMEEMLQRKPGDGDLDKSGPQQKMMACKQIDLAIASDLSMFTKYGSTTAVQNHNIGVMNNVQTNYDNEFNDELHFEIVQQFVVLPPATDPWSSSTNASTLLSSFTSWGPTGFNTTHDLGQLWTDRDFDGSTIGLAWIGTVCNSFRYHCLQDFSTNAAFLRVLTSHEIGHNFSAGHDNAGSNTIMAPSVNSSNTWSSQSLSSINSYYPGISCLAACSSPQPPVASFTANPTTGCAPLTVSYTDQSTNVPTSWSWVLPGASPTASSSQNPTVTYNNSGSYNATLTVTNAAGNNTLNQSNLITVLTTPTPAFSHATACLTAFFSNASVNANSYSWDFGDGQTSNQANPTHTYAAAGTYIVKLTAVNGCGASMVTKTVTIPPPPAAGLSKSGDLSCSTTSVTLTASPATGMTYNWSAGATPVSGTNTATVTAAGTYTVTVTSTANGCTATASVAVGGVTMPPAAGAPSVTQPSCGNPTGTITVAASGSQTLEYSVNGGASYQASPVFSGLAPGGYNLSARYAAFPGCVASFSGNPVTLTAPTGCCPAVLAVNANPIAAGLHEASQTVTSSGVVAAGSSVTFNAQSVELLPGFEVLPGGELSVVLGGCIP